MTGDMSAMVEGFRKRLKEEARRELFRDAMDALSKPLIRRARVRGKTVMKARRKPPIQLCPVPRCKNRAAPVFGMLCAKHKGLSKSQVRKYREARRAKKVT